jgi:hypothetical protein
LSVTFGSSVLISSLFYFMLITIFFSICLKVHYYCFKIFIYLLFVIFNIWLINTLMLISFTVKFEIRNDRVMVVNLLHFQQYLPLKDCGWTHVLRKGNGSYFIRRTCHASLATTSVTQVIVDLFLHLFVGYILHAFIR